MREFGSESSGYPLPKIRGKVMFDEPMSLHTSFKIGGLADIFVIPADETDLQELLIWAKWRSAPVMVLGAGSNLLVADTGIRGLVIQMGPGFRYVHIHGTEVTTGAAVTLPALVRKTLGAGLAGLEGLAGIPGTVGGAVCMNAGTPAGCTKDTLLEVRALNPDGKIVNFGPDDLGMCYRKSVVRERGLIITEARFVLREQDHDGIVRIVEELTVKRRSTQPVGIGTAGSVFKNPEGGYAGQLLDRVGAKGMQVGGARVSSKHANFIENTGVATAKDVRDLMTELRRLVKENTGVDLEPEIQMVGEWD